MANDDEFAALMDGIGVKPLTADLKQRETARRPSLNTAAEGQLTGPRRSAAADRAQPSVTARHAAAAAAHERHDAVATQLLTEQGKLAVAERRNATLQSDLDKLRSDLDAARLELVALQTESTKLRQSRDQLAHERTVLQRRLAETKPPPVAATVVAVFSARGLHPGAEQEAALGGLAARWPAELLAAVESADAVALTRLLQRRVVLAGAGVAVVDADDCVVVRVADDRCEYGGASDVAAAWRRFVSACAAAGVSTVTVVGGTPVYRRRLKSLVKTGDRRLKMRLIAGDQRRPKHKAATDIRTSDRVLIWGGTELDHSVSGPYTDSRSPKVTAIAHRGITGMLDLAAAAIGPADS